MDGEAKGALRASGSAGESGRVASISSAAGAAAAQAAFAAHVPFFTLVVENAGEPACAFCGGGGGGAEAGRGRAAAAAPFRFRMPRRVGEGLEAVEFCFECVDATPWTRAELETNLLVWDFGEPLFEWCRSRGEGEERERDAKRELEKIAELVAWGVVERGGALADEVSAGVHSVLDQAREFAAYEVDEEGANDEEERERLMYEVERRIEARSFDALNLLAAAFEKGEAKRGELEGATVKPAKR